jgi:hypothetical protein
MCQGFCIWWLNNSKAWFMVNFHLGMSVYKLVFCPDAQFGKQKDDKCDIHITLSKLNFISNGLEICDFDYVG